MKDSANTVILRATLALSWSCVSNLCDIQAVEMTELKPARLGRPAFVSSFCDVTFCCTCQHRVRQTTSRSRLEQGQGNVMGGAGEGGEGGGEEEAAEGVFGSGREPRSCCERPSRLLDPGRGGVTCVRVQDRNEIRVSDCAEWWD